MTFVRITNTFCWRWFALRFAKMCLCQVSLLSRCRPRYLISSSWGSCTLFIRTGGHVSLRIVNVTWIDLDSLAFILHFLNLFWIASRLVRSFCVAMAGSLSVATTALSSAKVAAADSGEVGRPAVYSGYNNGPRTLPWSTPALTEDSSVTRFQPLRGSVCYVNSILG
jgi:hypothetical protein